MNDRFKFRVWDKREKRYIEAPSPTPLLQADGLLAYFTNNPEYMENYDIQFCTGLKDNNGKLIYEGDIMLVYGKIKEVVYWSKRQFQLGKKHSFCANCKEIGYKRTCPTCYKYRSITATTAIKLFEESEVIGNIYENEELLDE